VVINYFHILRTGIRPIKAETPLIINTNAVLAGTVTFAECFKLISGWNFQIIISISDLMLSELAPRNIYKTPDALAF